MGIKNLRNLSSNDINNLIRLSESFEFNIEVNNSEYISKVKVSKCVLTFYYKTLNLNKLKKFWDCIELKSSFHLKYSPKDRENSFTNFDWKTIEEKKNEIEKLGRSKIFNHEINWDT